MNMAKPAVLSILLAFLAVPPANARDMGAVSKVYPIAEQDPVEVVKAKIAKMQKNGEWEALQKQWTQKTIQSVVRPKPVDGIKRTTAPRQYDFDPSVTLESDIVLPDGRVAYPVGTTVNPLDHGSFPRPFVFFDGDDPKQVEWAVNIARIEHDRVKFVLVRGSTVDATKALDQRVYFDQGAKLTSKLQLTQVPAIVRQNGRLLSVTEVALDE